MTETQLQLVRAGCFAGAFAVALLLQRLAPHARLRGSWRVNGGLWLVNAIVVGAVCGACAFTAARWAAREGLGILNAANAGAWAATPLAFLVLDLVSYAWHRANHRVPLLWRLHRVHHSDPSFTVSTSLRFHPGELLLSIPVRLATVVLVGASVEAVLVFEVAFTLANLVEHGDIDLPISFERKLARFCITPALHRRHHAKIRRDRDTNFGTVFSLWDRLFRTYADSDSASSIETGLPGVTDITVLGALTLPLNPAG